MLVICAPFHFHTSFTTYVYSIFRCLPLFQSTIFLDFVTIWISCKTLLPIGITANDELFAVLPESTLSPAIRHKIHKFVDARVIFTMYL